LRGIEAQSAESRPRKSSQKRPFLWPDPFFESFFRAVVYYSAIDKKLAQRFIEAVEDVKRRVNAFPNAGKLRDGYRMVFLKDFPYRFCYLENVEGQIVALVLFHFKQKGLLRP